MTQVTTNIGHAKISLLKLERNDLLLACISMAKKAEAFLANH